jgi:DNA-binding NarL/FixJ family response regulator
MIQFIKNLFKKAELDKNLALIRKQFTGNFKPFSDMEKAVLQLRLSGMDYEQVADALESTEAKVKAAEQEIIRKLMK